MFEPVGEAEFKAAMRNLAAGVSLITSACNGRRGGMTATAVCALSALPAQLLVCVNRGAATHALIARSGKFCVNLLSERHSDMAAVFGTPAGAQDRFASGHWTTLTTGAPVLEDALVALDCELSESIEAASHSIFIGRVVDLWLAQGDAPLLYFRSGYARLAAAA